MKKRIIKKATPAICAITYWLLLAAISIFTVVSVFAIARFFDREETSSTAEIVPVAPTVSNNTMVYNPPGTEPAIIIEFGNGSISIRSSDTGLEISEEQNIVEAPEISEPIEEPEIIEEVENVNYFDVPLDEDLQNHIFELCESYGVDPSIVIAMIETESQFDASIIGDNGNAFGLMQIQPRWHQDRMDSLGCTDLLDPYQNVTVGIDFLAELIDMEDSLEWALMAYNGGPAYAYNKMSNGVLSHYASAVLESSDELAFG